MAQTRGTKLMMPFKVLSLCRQDIIDEELMTEAEALALTDFDMEHIAESMAEGCGGYNFTDSLGYAVEWVKNNCTVCGKKQDADGRCGCTNQNQK